MKKINIYADGACLSNPGPGGYGVILEYGETLKELSGGEENTTNNRMELSGVIAGLNALTESCDVTIYTDSQYVVNGIEKGWAKSWQSRNWIKSDKTPALNPDLWEKLLDAISKHKVKFMWIRGHNGHIRNERCDTIARGKAEEIKSMIKSKKGAFNV